MPVARNVLHHEQLVREFVRRDPALHEEAVQASSDTGALGEGATAPKMRSPTMGSGSTKHAASRNPENA